MGDPNPVPDLTIIMCAYNEMGRIQPALEEVLLSLDGHSESVEIIVLDNCSTDGTREWLHGAKQPLVRVELNQSNLGKGGSIKKGIGMSRGCYVVIHDPDLGYRADDIWDLLDLAHQTRASLVLGSRVLGGHARYEYLHNYLGAWFLRTCTQKVAPVSN
jgi:glycosyltransferase involved in cell wall biosynthesis